MKHRKFIISISSLIIVFSLLLSPAMNAKNNYENDDGIFDTDSAIATDLDSCQDCVCSNDLFEQQLDSCYSPIQEAVVNIETTTDEFVSGLLSSDLKIKGTVTTASETIDINDYYDFDNTDKFSVASWACENQLITETQKYELYCQLINESAFENVDCLTSVANDLQYALNKNDIPDDLKNTIEETIYSSSVSRSNYDMSLYESSNFAVYYESSFSLSDAVNVANHFEQVRTQFIGMGFRQPIKETGESRYFVYLKTEVGDSEDLLASAFPNHPFNGKTCATYFVFYQFAGFNDKMKEVISHEYFHGIQNAYSRFGTENESQWFTEAAATWAAMSVSDSYSWVNNHILGYINSTRSIKSEFKNAHYGAALFPLTIDYLYGGYSAIRAIYEEYADCEPYPSEVITFEQLKLVIDEVLEDRGGSFNEAYCEMANYKYSPAEYFAPIHPGGSSATQDWNPRLTTENDTTLSYVINNTPIVLASSKQIQSYSSDYHKFVSNKTDGDGWLEVTVTFSGSGASDGVCYYHIEANNGFKQFYEMEKTGTNTYSARFLNYGGYTQNIGIIVSNLSTSNITYTASYTMENDGQAETLYISSNERYTEKTMNLGQGDYKNFIVSFAVAGNRVIQTFGSKNTLLQLFDANGNMIISNDDQGYERNAFISYNFAAGTQYRIRVSFENPSNSGYIRLAIIPTSHTNMYETITVLDESTSFITGTYTVNKVNLYTYETSTAQDLSVTLTSDSADTFLYIIDPRSTGVVGTVYLDDPEMTMTTESMYNDDDQDSSNSLIVKSFEANVPYLIIVAQYDPSMTDMGESFCLEFEQFG